MGLITLIFHLLLCQCLVQHTTSKIVRGIKDWNARGCCENCPALSDLVPDSNNQRYVKICQHGKSGTVSYFATVVDTRNRIPVFSKFTVYSGKKETGQRSFMYEAQLVDETLFEGNIGDFTMIKKQLKLSNTAVWDRIKTKQATKFDYIRSGYAKGHLRPHAGSENKEAEIATYTYTNAVPQEGTFNQGVWSSVEDQTRNFIEAARCSDNNHVVVVGAVPSSDQVNNRVTIPSFLWSYVKCADHIAVFLAPNIDNDLINKNKLLTVFFTSGKNLQGVLHKIRDLRDHGRTLNNIQSIITQFKNDTLNYAISPPIKGKPLLDNLKCEGIYYVKECGKYTRKRP